MKTPKRRRGRALLVATAGLAAVGFAGCGDMPGRVGPPLCNVDDLGPCPGLQAAPDMAVTLPDLGVDGGGSDGGSGD